MEDISYGRRVIVFMRIVLPKNHPMSITRTNDAMALGALFETRSGENLTGCLKTPATNVAIEKTYNSAVLVGTNQDWFWEDATRPLSSPRSKVRHYKSSV